MSQTLTVSVPDWIDGAIDVGLEKRNRENEKPIGKSEFVAELLAEPLMEFKQAAEDLKKEPSDPEKEPEDQGKELTDDEKADENRDPGE